MFGISGVSAPTGPQIRGFGFEHDGAIDTLLSFVSVPEFNFPGADEAAKAQNRLDMVDYLLSFDAELAPVLGQQVTLDSAGSATPLLAGSSTTVSDRIALLIERAQVDTPRDECDLIVKGALGGEPRGFWMSAADTFTPDKNGAANLSLAALLALAEPPGRSLTFLCVPGGSGSRLGIDRDEDGVRDGSQCGDVNLDGVVAKNDATLIRRALARVPGAALPVPQKCNSRGAADLGDGDGDGVLDDCNILDIAVISRAAAALPPGAAQVCAVSVD
jgi:hypothetical protein